MLFTCQVPHWALGIFISFNPLNQEAGSINYPYFADKKGKLRKVGTCPRSQSQQVTEMAAETLLMTTTKHNVISGSFSR